MDRTYTPADLPEIIETMVSYRNQETESSSLMDYDLDLDLLLFLVSNMSLFHDAVGEVVTRDDNGVTVTDTY